MIFEEVWGLQTLSGLGVPLHLLSRGPRIGAGSMTLYTPGMSYVRLGHGVLGYRATDFRHVCLVARHSDNDKFRQMGLSALAGQGNLSQPIYHKKRDIFSAHHGSLIAGIQMGLAWNQMMTYQCLYL